MLTLMPPSPRRHMIAPRQADRELGIGAGFAFHRDRTAMLLRDDVVADRKPETGAFAGWFGREERLKKTVAVFGRDAGAIVPYPNLDGLAEIARRDLQHGTERAIRFFLAFGCVEAIA